MIELEDARTWPEQGTLWDHTNGNQYVVEDFTNIQTTNQDQYPTTIVYKSVLTRRLYSRPLMDWDRSMKPAGGK